MSRTWYVLIPLLVVAACSRRAGENQASSTPAVTVARVEQRPLPVEVRASGRVEPHSTVEVRSEITGQLMGAFISEGDYVTKGQLLFEIDARGQHDTIRQLEADLARDSAKLLTAQAEAARLAEMFRQGVIPRQQHEQAQAAVTALEAALAADREAVETAQLRLNAARIFSPIDGQTGTLLIQEGNLVTANSGVIIRINQVRPIYVTFTVPERELPEIRRRFNSGLTTVVVLPDESSVTGRLTFIDNAIDASGRIKLKSTFPNADNRLFPGQHVSVILTLAHQPDAIVVPSQAVLSDGRGGHFTYIVGPDNKAHQRSVVIDRNVASDISVSAGLTPGETVVIEGHDALKPGAVVRVAGAGASGSAR